MSRASFASPEAFQPRERNYQLLPFKFMRLENSAVIVVNVAGEHHILDAAAFTRLAEHRLSPETPEYEDLKAKHFLYDSSPTVPITLLTAQYRTKQSFLTGFTKLHIFVVTLRCDHSCHYCQVSRVSMNKSKYDMSRDAADRAVNLVFQSPARELKIEFQGGEPLLNFALVRHVVEEASARNALEGRHLRFVVTTNLSFIDDEMLGFLREHNVSVSTSLDGPAFIHNVNRPRPEHDAYERVIEGIRRVREALGRESVSALMTTTKLSLDHPVEIVDEYVAQGFNHIFLRPISPYGFALRTQHKTGYELDGFIAFYKAALDRIIAINRAGRFLSEIYAQILLTKILTPFATSYVDLQSPAAAGIGVVVYNYDGDVYATDESRMLAQMGDTTFRLGSLENSYEHLFGGQKVRELTTSSVVDSLPGCADCAFSAYCGADPVENHATQGDIVGHRPTSRFCARSMGIIKHLLRLYYGPDPFIRELFWSWVQNAPAGELLARLPS